MNHQWLDREQVELSERLALVHVLEEYIQLLRVERQRYERVLEDSQRPPSMPLPKYVVGGALPSN